jgi:hypothetical protein
MLAASLGANVLQESGRVGKRNKNEFFTLRRHTSISLIHIQKEIDKHYNLQPGNEVLDHRFPFLSTKYCMKQKFLLHLSVDHATNPKAASVRDRISRVKKDQLSLRMKENGMGRGGSCFCHRHFTNAAGITRAQ